MGVGWVGIDRIDSSLVSIRNFKVVNWPISTKVELLGIWVVLLIVQYSIIVRVLTDSEQAIEYITKAYNIEQYSKWIRIDNRVILEKIASLVKQKGLKLELKKVQSHANNKWNNEADRLAKEGRRSYLILKLDIVKSENFNYDIAWRSNRIENSVKYFIAKLMRRYNNAE